MEDITRTSQNGLFPCSQILDASGNDVQNIVSILELFGFTRIRVVCKSGGGTRRRCRATRWLLMPVSSSSDAKMTPFAVCGCCHCRDRRDLASRKAPGASGPVRGQGNNALWSAYLPIVARQFLPFARLRRKWLSFSARSASKQAASFGPFNTSHRGHCGAPTSSLPVSG